MNTLSKITLIVMMSISTLIQAQQDFTYCQIIGQTKFMSNKVNVLIDFGQKQPYFSNQSLIDEDGQTITFNSMIDALNYMGSKGWEFVQAYTVTIGNQNVYHYLLKADPSQLTGSFQTMYQSKRAEKKSKQE